jgi:hypothetical protein
MKENRKYATYFPLFYEMSALTQLAGYGRYELWIGFYRYIFLACNLAIGFALYALTFSRRAWALSLLVVLFWYFNRWVLKGSQIAALDFIPIFLMVVSLGMFERHVRLPTPFQPFPGCIKRSPCFCAALPDLGISTRSFKKVIIAGLWIAGTLIVSFLLCGTPDSQVDCLSLTRDPHFGVGSIDMAADLGGFCAAANAGYAHWNLFCAWQKGLGRYQLLCWCGDLYRIQPVLSYISYIDTSSLLTASEWIIGQNRVAYNSLDV